MLPPFFQNTIPMSHFCDINSDQNKSTAHGCWTLDFFVHVSDIKLQAIYIIIEKLHFLKKF